MEVSLQTWEHKTYVVTVLYHIYLFNNSWNIYLCNVKSIKQPRENQRIEKNLKCHFYFFGKIKPPTETRITCTRTNAHYQRPNDMKRMQLCVSCRWYGMRACERAPNTIITENMHHQHWMGDIDVGKCLYAIYTRSYWIAHVSGRKKNEPTDSKINARCIFYFSLSLFVFCDLTFAFAVFSL